jgi:hypothetical protein
MIPAIGGGGALGPGAPEARAILDVVLSAVASGSWRSVTAGGTADAPPSRQAIPHRPSGVSKRQYSA